MTDRENLCREFTELTGGHWHDFGETKCGENSIQFLHCREYNGYLLNPTYTNPADVLRVMVRMTKCLEFIGWIEGNVGDDDRCYIPIDYILEPDKLLTAAVEFLSL